MSEARKDGPPAPGETPALWREELPIGRADEQYVSRRQFTKFLVLTSAAMFAGQLWMLVRERWLRRPTESFPAVRVARLGEIPVDGVRLFSYPTAADPCILVRTGSDEYVAYSQKCTHLSCAVYYAPAERRLVCPCHTGYFSVRTGRVLQGPPPRPLPRIKLERRGGELWAVGVDLNAANEG